MQIKNISEDGNIYNVEVTNISSLNYEVKNNIIFLYTLEADIVDYNTNTGYKLLASCYKGADIHVTLVKKENTSNNNVVIVNYNGVVTACEKTPDYIARAVGNFIYAVIEKLENNNSKIFNISNTVKITDGAWYTDENPYTKNAVFTVMSTCIKNGIQEVTLLHNENNDEYIYNNFYSSQLCKIS